MPAGMETELARPRAFNESDAVRLASRAFWNSGYQATAVRDLEHATGLTAGSLYKAYGSKRELFQLCVAQYMKEDSYVALLLRMFDTPLVEAMRRLFDTIIDSADAASDRPAGCLVSTLVSELLQVDAELGNNAVAGLQEMQKALRFRVKWARENGELSADEDDSALGAFLMVVVQGMLMVSTSTKDVAAMRAARDVALDRLRRRTSA